MSIGFLIQSFFKVGREAWGDKGVWRRAQLSAAINEDFRGYLESKSLEFAADHRDMGYDITDERVYQIMHEPDAFYCGHTTPINFAEMGFNKAQIAVMAVRETIREDLGIALPRLTISQLKSLDLTGLNYER